MRDFSSGLAPAIAALLDYREALGYARNSHLSNLLKFDAFCAHNYPGVDYLTKDMVVEWLDEQVAGVHPKTVTIRLLGRYLKAIGKESFIMPRGMSYERKTFAAYIFTDNELRNLFCAADATPPAKSEPFIGAILPVLLRLIYTCGLRPNEGRELLHKNIDFKTGELLISNTKYKKDRLVVMSGDMLRLCREYDEYRKVFGRDNPYFFPSWGGGALVPNQLTHFFKEAWIRAHPEVPKDDLPRVRVYDLRHRFASAALNRWLDTGKPLGAKLPYLRTYMGHSTLNETAHYIHLLPENLVKSAGIDWQAFDELVPNPFEPGVGL